MSLKIRILCLLLIMIVVTHVYGQGTPPPFTQVIPPAPNVMAMQKYGDIPVSEYTGVPNISIPLYSIKFHDITVPISVSYHASGIKVAEEASNVGLGWVLNAGGAISRNIIGSDDFMAQLNYPEYFGVFNNFDIADGYSPVTPIQIGGILTLTNGQTPTQYNLGGSLQAGGLQPIDYQPDQFYYNVQGLSGKFLMRRDYQPILQSQAKIDISCNTLGTIWDIKTLDGFDYHFSQVETSRNSQDATGISHISAVYLTQITSPAGNIVTFNYSVQSNNEVSSIGSFTESRDDGVYSLYKSQVSYQLTPSRGQNVPQIYNTVYLANIDYGTGRVVFNYSNTRQDITSDYELDEIQVFTKNSQGVLSSTPIKTVNLSYSYAQGTDYPNTYYGLEEGASTLPLIYTDRLQLNSITESGAYNGQSVTKKPYVFSYNAFTPGPLALPAKTSLARDFWGYYNGSNNSSLIPQYTLLGDPNPLVALWGIPDNSRNSNGTFATAFALSDIQYPEGGTTHFDYEVNDCDEQKSYVNDKSSTPYPFSIVPGNGSGTSLSFGPGASGVWTGQTIDMTDLFVTSNTLMPVTINAFFRMASSSGTPVSIAKGQAYLSIQNLAGTEIAQIDPGNNNSSITGGLQITGTLPISTPGVYKIVPVVNTSTAFGSGLAGISSIFTWYTEVNSSPASTVTNPTTYSAAGGLRIKRITDNDGINPPKIKRYIYHYNVGQTPEYSYGRRMSRPEFSYWELSSDMFQTDNIVVATNTYTPSLSEHLMRLSDSNIPLNGSAQGMVVGYDQVTVNYGENGENGKTVYQYYNNPDVIPLFTLAGMPAKRPYGSNIPDPLNGSLLKQTDYINQNGQFLPVKDIVNTYAKSASKENYIYGVEDHIPLKTTWSDGHPTSIGFSTNGGNDRYLFTYSPLQSEWTYLSSTDEKNYSTNNPASYTETLTNYFYDNPLHYLPTRTVTTNSKKEIITSTTTYPLDFTNLTNSDGIAPGISNLIANHMINTPVEKYINKTAADGTNLRTLSGSLTTYSSTGPSLPSKIYELQSVAPLTNFAPYATTGLKNAGYQPQSLLSFDQWDPTNGNLLQQHKEVDVNYAYQWGYNNEYPVAQCKNAAVNEFFYEGFEENTLTGVTSTGAAHTGHYFYSGSSYAVSWTIPTARSYVISYWYLTSAGVWTYSGEINYTANSYTLTGGVGYDDIRIYPVDAQLTTYTFDTGVGMTSTTDPKGKTSYFEYDGLQRLMNIKDPTGNIIKNFSYNYATPLTGVQPIYYNAAQSGIFQFQGCTGNTVGTNVVYTVSPGTYTTTISQAWADGLAQADVTKNGQNFANSAANGGACIVPVYYNDASSTTFTCSCAVGNTGSLVVYTVPFGQYTSGVSKAAANQLAQQDIATNGQTYANNHGTCTPVTLNFSITNSSSSASFVLQFSGPSSASLTVTPSSTSIISLPAGLYTLTVTPPTSSGTPPSYSYILGVRAQVDSQSIVTFNSPLVNVLPGGELNLLIFN